MHTYRSHTYTIYIQITHTHKYPYIYVRLASYGSPGTKAATRCAKHKGKYDIDVR
jgi:hypothetical protein